MCFRRTGWNSAMTRTTATRFSRPRPTSFHLLLRMSSRNHEVVRPRVEMRLRNCTGWRSCFVGHTRLRWERRGAYFVLNALRCARNFPAEQRFKKPVHRVQDLDPALRLIHCFAQLSAMRHAVGEPRRELLHLAFRAANRSEE